MVKEFLGEGARKKVYLVDTGWGVPRWTWF